MRRVLTVLAAVILSAGAAAAQASFDDFLEKDAAAQASEGVADAELAKFEDVLNGPDVDRAIRAMRYMMASGKPRLVRAAKSFGLRSTQTLFQEQALKAILDTGGPFKLEFDLTTASEDESKIKYRTQGWGTSFSSDGKSATLIFTVGPYDPEKKCWISIRRQDCSMMLALTTVRFVGWGIAGALTLDQKGILSGDIRNDQRPSYVSVPARIPLIK
ncbi:MAG: hypothetical protein AAF899_02035 [Pseudomonadota bacterium]